jgi:predicted secreted protein
MQKMADKGRLTVQQRVQTDLFFVEIKSVVETQMVSCPFGIWWAPAPKTIHRLHQQFQQDSTVLEKKRGRAASVRSPQNIEAVRVAMQRSQGKSTQKAMAELRISRRSVQRIL